MSEFQVGQKVLDSSEELTTIKGLFIDDNGVECAELEDGSVVETAKLTPVIEHDGKLYRMANRKANIDDLIIIVKPIFSGNIYEKGDIFTTEEIGTTGVEVYEHGGFIFHEEYRVLEPIEAEVPAGPRDTHEAIANLAVKVSQLEKRLDAPTRAEFLEIIRRAEEMHHERMTLILRVFSELGADR